MRRIVMSLFLAAQAIGATQSVSAQMTTDERVGRPWMQLGVFSLGVRGGVDLEQSGQALAGASFDVGYVWVERLRLRVVGELGFAPSPNSYVGSFEMVYRFTPDSAIAVPYLGTGIGVAGSEACGSDPDCPAVWLQFALGFELQLNRVVNWFMEYHPQNALRRHRILVGITMRPGST